MFTPVAAGGWNHYKHALKDFAYVDNATSFDASATVSGLSEGNGVAGKRFILIICGLVHLILMSLHQ